MNISQMLMSGEKITLTQLNEAHRAWMALETDASAEEKQRVYEMMKCQPRQYITGTHKNGFGLISGGLPLTAIRMPIERAIQMAESRGIQTKFAWMKSKWVDLTEGQQ